MSCTSINRIPSQLKRSMLLVLGIAALVPGQSFANSSIANAVGTSCGISPPSCSSCHTSNNYSRNDLNAAGQQALVGDYSAFCSPGGTTSGGSTGGTSGGSTGSTGGSTGGTTGGSTGGTTGGSTGGSTGGTTGGGTAGGTTGGTTSGGGAGGTAGGPGSSSGSTTTPGKGSGATTTTRGSRGALRSNIRSRFGSARTGSSGSGEREQENDD